MFKPSTYGLLIAVVLSTQVLASPVSAADRSMGPEVGKVTFNPLVVTKKKPGTVFTGTVRPAPSMPNASGPPPARHITIGGVAGRTLAPHCVRPLVAVAYCVEREPNGHHACLVTAWRCAVPGAADVNSARQ